MIGQFEGGRRRPQGLGGLVSLHQTAHLHLAGGDHAQVDAAAGQGVEQPGRHPGAAEDPRPGDAQLGEAPLGGEGAVGGPGGVQQHLADLPGPFQLGRGEGEGDVVGGPLLGGLHDQVHVEAGA